jgi:hypothetical protein
MVPVVVILGGLMLCFAGFLFLRLMMYGKINNLVALYLVFENFALFYVREIAIKLWAFLWHKRTLSFSSLLVLKILRNGNRLTVKPHYPFANDKIKITWVLT